MKRYRWTIYYFVGDIKCCKTIYGTINEIREITKDMDVYDSIRESARFK